MEQIKFTLSDQESGNTIKCEAQHECYSGLYLRFDGYGEGSAEDGHGWRKTNQPVKHPPCPPCSPWLNPLPTNIL